MRCAKLTEERERLAADALDAEALRRSDALKTALLRAVSHDLRSPLMAILTSAGALAHGELTLDPDDRRELAETILGEAGRLDRVVSNLLDLSRLQAGAAAPEAGDWPVDDLVLQALDGVEGGSRVEVVLPEDDLPLGPCGPPPGRACRGESRRERAPLLAPRRACPCPGAGEPVRRCWYASSTTGRESRPARPTGSSSRSNAARSACQRRGAGLGLAIARGFAEANGGKVWVESHAGQGATFVLALPVAQGARVGVSA